MRIRAPLLLVIPLLLVVACAPDRQFVPPSQADEAAALPTSFVLPTETPLIAPTSTTGPPPTAAAQVPTEDVAEPIITAEFEAEQPTTPTLQPSKTPTITPTATQFATLTVTPTTTVTATATATDEQFVFSGRGQSSNARATSIAAGPDLGGDNPFIQPPPRDASIAAQNCTAIPWWFNDFSPDACPQEEPTTGQGVFQRFEHGYMVWTAHNDRIYIMYSVGGDPSWQVFDDPFQEGSQETDPNWGEQRPPESFQPRRGFGTLWRDRPDVRDRLGWSMDQYEAIYTPRFQRGIDGSITIEHPSGSVFYLQPRGGAWALYPYPYG